MTTHFKNVIMQKRIEPMHEAKWMGFNLQYRKMLTLHGYPDLVADFIQYIKEKPETHFVVIETGIYGYCRQYDIPYGKVFCLRTNSKKVSKARLVFYNSGLNVQLITVLEGQEQASCAVHNEVVDMFIHDFVDGRFEVDFDIDIQEAYEPLNTVVEEETAVALENWESSCQRDPQYKVTGDEQLFRDAIFAVRNDSHHITGGFLGGWLLYTKKWDERSTQSVEQFAYMLDFSLALIDDYCKRLEDGTQQKIVRPVENQETATQPDTIELPEEIGPDELFVRPLSPHIRLPFVSKDMKKRLYKPTSLNDLYRINTFFRRWLDLARTHLAEGSISLCIDICGCVLYELGYRFDQDRYFDFYIGESPFAYTCKILSSMIKEILYSSRSTGSTKIRLYTALEKVEGYAIYKNYQYLDITSLMEEVKTNLMETGGKHISIKFDSRNKG